MNYSKIVRKINLLVDRYFWYGVFLMSVIVIGLNYNASTMSGILPYYRDYKHIILSGFNLQRADILMNSPTFPMWGYGWVFLITENKLLLLLTQNGLAIFALWFVLRFIKNRGSVPIQAVRLIKLLIVICIPWYAFHSVLWPYSFALSLLLISFILFVQSFEQNNNLMISKTIFAGLCWGIALNLRSDYFLLPFCVVILALLHQKFHRTTILKSVCFLVTIFLLVVPWMLYTKMATGKYYIRSTNGAAVWFHGLGQLPNNKWGILPDDGDPKMHSLLREHFGKDVNFCGHEADDFLKTAFLNEVKADPLEYVRKCLNGVKLVLTYGVYQGGFFDSESSSGFRSTVKEFAASPETFLRVHGFHTWRFFLLVVSWLYGLGILLLSYFLLPVTIFYAIKEKDLFLLVLFLGIGYQSAIGIFAYHLHVYASNMLLFHIINVGIGIVLIKNWWTGRVRKPACAA